MLLQGHSQLPFKRNSNFGKFPDDWNGAIATPIFKYGKNDLETTGQSPPP